VGVYATTDPQAGASAWREVSGQAGINDIACAGVHLCIAVGQRLDNSVFVLGTRTPLKAGRNWRVTAALGAEFNGAFSAASCPSVRLCVISDADGDVDTSTKPLSSARAWRQFRLAGMGRSVSCATPQLCVSVTDTDVVTSTRPGPGPEAARIPSPTSDRASRRSRRSRACRPAIAWRPGLTDGCCDRRIRRAGRPPGPCRARPRGCLRPVVFWIVRRRRSAA
jgi:hypothetical protein